LHPLLEQHKGTSPKNKGLQDSGLSLFPLICFSYAWLSPFVFVVLL